jgi:hypothetical protein
MTDVESKLNNFKPLTVFTKNFNTCIQHYHIASTGNNIIIDFDVDQMHLKEIIICCTKNEIKYKPIKSFTFYFDDSFATYTSIDCEIYQTLHHETINNNIYTIGFSLEPDCHYSTGCVNYKKLKFSYDTFDTDFKMDIYLVGFKYIN